MSQSADDLPAGQRSYRDILARQIELGVAELERPTGGLFLSGLSAGLDIGFGPLLMAVIVTIGTESLPAAVTELFLANAYAVGFLFVVLGRSELFTEHTTLAVLPVLDRRASLGSLGRLWAVVLAANVAGGAVFAAFVVTVAPGLDAVSVEAFAELARPLVGHDLPVLFASAVLAGWLMGLLSWLVAAAEDTVSRVLVVWIVAAAIGLAHLPHSVAGNVEVLMGLLTTAAITPVDYGRFLLAAASGNAVGGVVFVALLKYGHVAQSAETAGSGDD